MRNAGSKIGASIIRDQIEADHQSCVNIVRQKKREWALNSFEKKLMLYTQSHCLAMLGISQTSFYGYKVCNFIKILFDLSKKTDLSM